MNEMERMIPEKGGKVVARAYRLYFPLVNTIFESMIPISVAFILRQFG